jgi:hypothetical protein
MGNLNLGAVYSGMPMKFTNIGKLFRFEKDVYNKTKSQLSLGVDDCAALDAMAMDLKEYLQGMFSHRIWHVRSPHYKGDIKLNWPTHKGSPTTVVCYNIEAGASKDVNIEGFNDIISFRNLQPKAVNVNAKLWLRGDNDEDGNLIYTVGVYFTLDTLEF